MRRTSVAVAIGILALTVFVGSPRSALAGTPFTDVADSAFLGDINWAYDNGITGGCTETRFCPEANVTRGQMASFLVRMFDLPPTSTDHFTDDEGNIHEASINALAESGVTGGCRYLTDYCPNAIVTREQMAAFIVRAARLPRADGVNQFYDDDFTYFEADIGTFAAAGVGAGCGEYRFCPRAPVTREQMVAFLHRVVDRITPPPEQAPCDRSYTPALCIPPPPPQLDCTDISYRNFAVRAPDPHVFDGNGDGIGCEA